jgi:polyhydroxybutyrate depolymerase
MTRSKRVVGLWAGALAIFSATGACSGGGDSTRGDAGPDAASIIAARPYDLRVPAGYDRSSPTPLVIMLHGYGVPPAAQENYFQFAAVADEQMFLYAYPGGTVDPTNARFWNADDACCNFFGSDVDDVGYLRAVIDDASAKNNVDPKRIFVVGHSNGAFMSHRLACDLSERIAAIASLAGAVWNDGSKCNPSGPVSVLDVHGDADGAALYGGGAIPAGLIAPGTPPVTQPPYPSQAQTMALWAAKNGCTGALAPNGVTLDLDAALAGAETSESAYTGCPPGIGLELWTIRGGGHVPILAQPNVPQSIYTFFKAHPKP